MNVFGVFIVVFGVLLQIPIYLYKTGILYCLCILYRDVYYDEFSGLKLYANKLSRAFQQISFRIFENIVKVYYLYIYIRYERVGIYYIITQLYLFECVDIYNTFLGK